MSNTDTLHKKVLVTNALKTNFISNTNPKNKEHQKRFSNISKEKDHHQYRQTIHKNTTRYNDEIDMHGSATILPQKNSSRKNIYMNQNTNTIVQPGHQRKQSTHQLNLNATKAKSPIDKVRIPNTNPVSYQGPMIGPVSQTISNQTTIGNQTQMMIGNNIVHYTNQMCQQQIVPNQVKGISQIKNLGNKVTDVMTDRQKSQRGYFQRQQHSKDQQFKIKSMIVDNVRKYSNQIQQLMCDEEIQINLMPQKQLSRKVSNQYNKNIEAKNTLKQKQEIILITDHNSHTRTQKKCYSDKPTLILEKAKSQHNITFRQNQNINSATLVNNNGSVNNNGMANNNNGPATNSNGLITNNNGLITNNNGNKSIPQLGINHEANSNRQHRFYAPQMINYDDEIRKFSLIQPQLNVAAEIQTIFGLENRQIKYVVQPNYIQLKQKNLNWFMRAILVDWMMHVCYQFGLKRETFHLAVALADKYLQKTTDLPKSDFQLTGAATMFIAAKLEQFQALSSGDFSKSTDNRYSSNQIRQMQLKICKTMGYQLNPPTLFMWANRFMVHWDNYIDLTEAKFHPYFKTHKPKYFKKEDQQSYSLFREMMQFIDCSILDVQTLQFVPKILVCSFMYLVLGKNYKEWPQKRIVQEFPRSSHYLVQEEGLSQFNELFHMFLADSFELDIIELLPAVQYCSTYFTLPLSFDPPSYALKNGQEQGKMILQEYETFQTYNGKMMDLVKKRYRGVYP